MNRILKTFSNSLLVWFKSLKHWKKIVLIAILVLLCLYWLLVISDIGEWWHWEEWQAHIQNEYK